MDFFKIIFIIYFFCINSVININIDEYEEETINNIIAGNIFWVNPEFDNRNIEIRFFFPKKDFSSNPNPFTIVYDEDNSYMGILKTYQDSTKDYYIVYGTYSCQSYSYKENDCDVDFKVIPNKNITSCIVTLSSVNDTSLEGKLLFFGLIVFCILISIITILKTKACGDCGVKSENPFKIQNVPIQPQTQPQSNIQNEELLIQP